MSPMGIDDYETIIGLEVHVELSTKSKIFCGCSAGFGASPNENTCPVCLGIPGALPVLNEEVVRKAAMAGQILGCEIGSKNIFDRKNYFYPDLPKAYQISQLYSPICVNGSIKIGERKIRIHEIHMEEDAGKLVHEGAKTLIDYNRCGVPLIEIVTEPDFRSREEVAIFLETLREALSFADVSDCKMEEGSMRADVNLSLRKLGSEALGTRTETKNLNSIKACLRAIDFEEKRQASELSAGRKIVQETRKWDDANGEGYSMRSKENAQDYRYFPDPDLTPNSLSEEYLNSIKESLPELPAAKRVRYKSDYGMSDEIIATLTGGRKIARYFEEATSLLSGKKEIIEAANMIAGQSALPKEPAKVAKLSKMISAGLINRLSAKEVLEEIAKSGGDPEEIADKKGFIISSNIGDLAKVVDAVLSKNEKARKEYLSGKERAFGFLVGQVMRELKGAGNPADVNALLKEKLSKD
jgi:aspartyl-tRNA(Asn)/glutamyl-tRNA(Gln) amidotransferase subunit B